jgi:hypothetical protein
VQTLGAVTEPTFTGNANDDQVRMVNGRVEEKGAGRFDAGVASLNDLLRMGKVFADETVDVRRALVSHGSSSFHL